MMHRLINLNRIHGGCPDLWSPEINASQWEDASNLMATNSEEKEF